MFKGIYKLPAGCWLTVDADGTHRRRTATGTRCPGRASSPTAIKGLSDGALEEFYVDGIRERLRAAVEKRHDVGRAVRRVPVGRHRFLDQRRADGELMDQPVDTFTVGFKDHQHLNELE